MPPASTGASGGPASQGAQSTSVRIHAPFSHQQQLPEAPHDAIAHSVCAEHPLSESRDVEQLMGASVAHVSSWLHPAASASAAAATHVITQRIGFVIARSYRRASRGAPRCVRDRPRG
jgi:hypothetical protein